MEQRRVRRRGGRHRLLRAAWGPKSSTLPSAPWHATTLGKHAHTHKHCKPRGGGWSRSLAGARPPSARLAARKRRSRRQAGEFPRRGSACPGGGNDTRPKGPRRGRGAKESSAAGSGLTRPARRDVVQTEALYQFCARDATADQARDSWQRSAEFDGQNRGPCGHMLLLGDGSLCHLPPADGSPPQLEEGGKLQREVEEEKQGRSQWAGD